MFHHYLRKILPFLYIRNWYSGQFELSIPRVVILGSILFLLVIFFTVAYALGKPLIYSK